LNGRPPPSELLFWLVLSVSACTTTGQGGGSGSSSSGSSASSGGAGGSTGNRASSSSGGTTGGGSTGGACPTTPHCVAGNFWTVDCNGRIDGGPCQVDSQCNATGTACITGKVQPCTSDADCDCQWVCGDAGSCVAGGNNPKSSCASDLDCGPACEGLTCIDGGCEALTCGPLTCAPGCACSGYGVCACPRLPDAGPTCSSYFETQCLYGCLPDLPDGGCYCNGGVVDALGRCAACVQDSDCDAGLYCDIDPNAFSPYETCVQCTTSSQCDAGMVCDTSRNLCVADCRLDAGICDAGCAQSGVCGECTSDADCATGSACVMWPDGGETYGIPPECHQRCQGDAGCSSLHPVCDPTAGYCVDCLTNADCQACTPPRGPCTSGFCLSAVACY
jgi:hypothetical protein